jgi:excisionase family DNA binding protein
MLLLTEQEGVRPMNQRRAFEIAPSGGRQREVQTGSGGIFEQHLIQQLLLVAKPQIRALIREVIADEGGQPLVVDYEEAGRMIGTSYEGVRKLVRKGRLTAVSRSGRHRGIAVSELKNYVERSQVAAGDEPHT